MHIGRLIYFINNNGETSMMKHFHETIVFFFIEIL